MGFSTGGVMADLLKLKTGLPLTVIRDIFAGLGFGLKGIFFIALGFAPTEIHATILLSLSLGFSGLAVAGYAVNVIDLAPNFSGLVMGFANSVSTFTGILSTLIATLVLHHLGLGMRNGWLVALGLAALSQFSAMVIYLVFASGKEQPWAYADGEAGQGRDQRTEQDGGRWGAPVYEDDDDDYAGGGGGGRGRGRHGNDQYHHQYHHYDRHNNMANSYADRC